jgi:hypothetical protein
MNPISRTLSVLKKLHVNKVYRNVERYLPDWFNSSITSLSDRYIAKRLIITGELLPKYNEAFSYLHDQLGPDALGDYLEFGVCHGSSMLCMHQTIRKLKLKHVRMFGFDSFEGLPAIAAEDDNGKWKPGEFATRIETTVKYLSEEGIDWDTTFLIKGWFSDTLTEETRKKYSISKASVIMVDCDIYSSAKDSLNFCAPLIKDKAIIFFDDWIGNDIGEGKALAEFMTENPHFRLENFGTYKPSGEIYLISNTLSTT